jgi:hypothetical protein
MNAMSKTVVLIMLWSCIAVVTTNMDSARAAERALDLAEANTVAMIVGKYEGRWLDTRTNRNGSLVVTFSMHPDAGEKPFNREMRVGGSATIDPNKAFHMRGKIDQRKLIFFHTSGWTKYTFYEENGQIKARGEYGYETGPLAGSGGIQELVKIGGIAQTAAQKKD